MTKGRFYYTLRDKVRNKSWLRKVMVAIIPLQRPPNLRLHVDGTMGYHLRMLEEPGVTRRIALRGFGCLFYMRLAFIWRERDEGN